MNNSFNNQNFRLVSDTWEYHAKNHPDSEAVIHWDVLDGHFRWNRGDLFNKAVQVACELTNRGIQAGDVCALIMRHHRYFYPLYMGIALSGAIPAVLAYPNPRLHPDKFIHGLSGIAKKSGINWVLTERDLEPAIKPLMMSDNKQSLIKGILLPLEWVEKLSAEKPDYESIKKQYSQTSPSDPFLLQHSSGTTGLQKAVMLSHHAVLEHAKRYANAVRLSEKDKVVSWLPLYHDMGLNAAFLLPLIFGIPLIQIDPFQWISGPSLFFQAISEEKTTLTWLPNFAYDFMADRVREEEMKNIDLSSMRLFINCSEPVRFASHEKFFNRYSKYGLQKKTLATCYAMAETTFAVTQSGPDQEPGIAVLDRDTFSKGTIELPKNEASKKICVSSGKPISGCSLKIMSKNGAELPENKIGRIAVKSASLFNGYRHDPEKTKAALQNGWYVTGDLGFLHRGEYYVIGREDDLIIVAGKNLCPEDIESAVGQVRGAIPGRVVAFGVENEQTGTQDVCVMAETSIDKPDDINLLKLAVKQAGMAIDVTISVIYLVPPRSLIKSSSGKLSRKANKERAVSGKVSELVKS